MSIDVRGPGIPDPGTVDQATRMRPPGAVSVGPEAAECEVTSLSLRPVPELVDQRLQVVENLCASARRQLIQASDELAEAGWSAWEIEALWLRRLRLMPKPPVTITNAELARHGLARHPEAVGVSRNDRGHAIWVSCGECLSKKDYAGLPPDEESVVLYVPLHCDTCDEDVAAP